MVALFHSSADRVSQPEVRSVLPHLVLGLFAMLLLGLAFPSPGWWPLAHAALAPVTLLAAWAVHWKRLLWTTFIASYIWWLFRLNWLIDVTGGGYAALAAYMALYIPVTLLVWRIIDKRFRLPAVITFPIVFVSFEYIRGTFLQGGMAWFGLGHSQAPYKPGQATMWFVQVADIAGDWTVTFLVAMSNGVIVDVVRAGLGRSRLRSAAPSMMIWFIIYAAALIYGYQRAGIDDSSWPAVDVAVVQTNAPQSNRLRPTPQTMAADWERVMQLSRLALAADPKPAILVWPETMVPVELNPQMLAVFERIKETENEGKYLQFHIDIGNLTREHQLNLFVGSGARTATPEPGREKPRIDRYNSAFHYRPDGSQNPESYSKIDLVPFGEYIPWVDAWPWLKEKFLEYLSPYGKGNDYSLTRGPKRTVFTTPLRDGREVRVTTPICFEDAFARSTLALCYDKNGKRCDIMLNLTNDGWYPGTHQGLQHVQMAALRCIETRVPMARSVNTGVSVFIDSRGRVGPFVVGKNGEIQQIDGFAAHAMRIDPRSSIFGSVGTAPVLILCFTTAVLTAAALVTRKRP